jgi:hypothetical protein
LERGNELIKITSNSIGNVPKTESDVISKRYWEQLYKEHIDLLKLAQDKQLGTECARVFDLNMNKLGNDFIGKSGENRVLVSNFDTPHVIIHNHADGSTISLEDLTLFYADRKHFLFKQSVTMVLYQS